MICTVSPNKYFNREGTENEEIELIMKGRQRITDW